MSQRATHALQFISLSMSLFLLMLFNITSVSASVIKRAYWPTDYWRHSTPEAQGMDSGKLMKVTPFIINNLSGIQSLMIIRHGYVVFENYYGPGMPDRQENILSVTKSVTSALVGIAKDKGLMGDLDQTLPDFFPEYFDNTHSIKKNITLQHLLTMSAGLKPVSVEIWGSSPFLTYLEGN